MLPHLTCSPTTGGRDGDGVPGDANRPGGRDTDREAMTSSDIALVGSYDYRVVALSIVIAVLSSYTAFDLAERVTDTRGLARLAWLVGGAMAMGIGIWSMHYTGMLAFNLPVPVQYDWPTALLSLCAGVFSSAVALFVISRRQMGALRAFAGSIFMGGGIVVLHYTGMEAMRLPAMCHYSAALVTLSVLCAIAGSLMALWLTFLFRGEFDGQRLRKAASALLMGAAIAGMHYTAMAAASFTRSTTIPDLAHAVSISSLGIAGIGVVTVMVLGVALLTSLVGRLQKSEERFRIVSEMSVEYGSKFRVQPDGTLVLEWITEPFIHTQGYSVAQINAIGWPNIVHPDDRAAVVRHFERAVAGETRVSEYRIIDNDGRVSWLCCSLRPVRDRDDRVAYLYGAGQNITDRKQAEAERERYAARLLEVQEEERRLIARELHDEIGQALTAVKFNLQSVRGLGELGAVAIDEAIGIADRTLQQVRDLSLDLRPSLLDDLGLSAALRWYLDRHAQSAARTTQFTGDGH